MRKYQIRVSKDAKRFLEYETGRHDASYRSERNETRELEEWVEANESETMSEQTLAARTRTKKTTNRFNPNYTSFLKDIKIIGVYHFLQEKARSNGYSENLDAESRDKIVAIGYPSFYADRGHGDIRPWNKTTYEEAIDFFKLRYEKALKHQPQQKSSKKSSKDSIRSSSQTGQGYLF